MIPPLGEWIDPRAFSLPISAFHNYLLTHGWKLQSSSQGGFVFAGPLADDGEPIIMVMPASEKAVDFAARVDDFFRRLSILEERHPMEILQEMLRRAEMQRLSPNGKNGTSRSKPASRKRKRVAKK